MNHPKQKRITVRCDDPDAIVMHTEHPKDADIMKVWTQAPRVRMVKKRKKTKNSEVHEVKKCTDCKKTKRITKFIEYESNGGRSFFTSKCQSCTRQHQASRTDRVRKEMREQWRALRESLAGASSADRCCINDRL